MRVNCLNDQLLLQQTKDLVNNEREILTQILHFLREFERRRLFSDLGYSSLFDYAVRELKYSEGQAGRRIQAMRIVKELLEIEQGIASGELSLSNLSSAREGQKEILKWQPKNIDVARFEKERQVTPNASEVRFLMTDKMRQKLENVRSLLGPKAVNLSYAELFETMAELSVAKLEENRFEKKVKKTGKTPTSEQRRDEMEDVDNFNSQNPRYIPKKLKAAVWRRDLGKCCLCSGTHLLNFDHVRPIGIGGKTSLENLRLLCFHCNQRQSVKTFGVYNHTG